MKSFLETAMSASVAGLVVDIVLFPLDTLKTWRQEKKRGNQDEKNDLKRNIQKVQRNVYRGMSAMMIGSVPSSLVFFTVYEKTQFILIQKKYENKKTNTDDSFDKNKSIDIDSKNKSMLSLVFASCLGEVAACTVRVPTELIKQRTQAGQYASSWETLKSILHGKMEGKLRGLYRGYTSTIIRDLPFASLQFPLWEILKQKITDETTISNTLVQSAISGSIASGIAAALTTPLDLIKTRIMLDHIQHNWIDSAKHIIKEEGIHALFKGITFRVIWISMGGALFLGTYDGVRQLMQNLLN